jgi:hypothetical protein
MSPASCAHPEAQRTRLSSGRGYRCEVCRTVVFDQTQEICVSPTADTVRLTKDEKALVRFRKADKRRDELKAINDAAVQFVKNWKEAETFGNDIIKLHQKFSNVFEASKPLLETVLDGFAHLRKGEKIQGHTTAKEWCTAVLGVSYERVRQLRTAKLSLAEPIVIISDNPQQGNERPKLSAEGRSAPARKGAGTRKRNVAAKSGEENERPEDETPSVPHILANTRPSFAIHDSAVDGSETFAKEDAARRIVSWALSSIRQFTLIEKRRIVEEVIAKLRDEMIFDTADARKAAVSAPVPGKPRTSSGADLGKVGSGLVVANEENVGALSESAPS